MKIKSLLVIALLSSSHLSSVGETCSINATSLYEFIQSGHTIEEAAIKFGDMCLPQAQQFVQTAATSAAPEATSTAVKFIADISSSATPTANALAKQTLRGLAEGAAGQDLTYQEQVLSFLEACLSMAKDLDDTYLQGVVQSTIEIMMANPELTAAATATGLLLWWKRKAIGSCLKRAGCCLKRTFCCSSRGKRTKKKAS